MTNTTNSVRVTQIFSSGGFRAEALGFSFTVSTNGILNSFRSLKEGASSDDGWIYGPDALVSEGLAFRKFYRNNYGAIEFRASSLLLHEAGL